MRFLPALGLLSLLVLTVGAPAAAADGATSAPAEPESGRVYPEKDWALGAMMRGATIPFATDEGRVASFVPMLFFEGDRLFFRGTEGGLYLYEKDRWRFSALGRLHFFDIPSAYQNQIQGDTVDWGLQARYRLVGPTFLDFEILSDLDGHVSANFRYEAVLRKGSFAFMPYGEAKIKTRKYNSNFYGLGLEGVAGGADLSVGFKANYHLLSNLYAFGALKVTYLDKYVRSATVVNSDFLNEVFLGVGLSNDRTQPKKENLETTAYWRLAHGWATPSSLAQIIRFNAEDDPYNNQMTSIFYGLPLTNRLFGLPLDLYLNGGFVWHWKSEVQSDAQEVVFNIKLYYTVPWPIRWRLGAAEGFSYVNNIPYVEETQLGKKGYEPSNLLNYLDFSVDLNVGDITGGQAMKHWWLGYSIHHRSAIFESAQQFGRIKGGSNFQTLYLQWHY